MRHIGPRVQPQILHGLEARTRPENGRNHVQRSEAAMALAMSSLESVGGRKPEEALDWLLLAASLGHALAKASIYRVTKALGLYEAKKEQVLPYLISSARDGVPISVEDLMEADPDQGQEVLQMLKTARRRECEDAPNLLLINTKSVKVSHSSAQMQQERTY